MNVDPIGKAGGLNLHQFLGNSPANAIDPFGLDYRRYEGSLFLEPVFQGLEYTTGDTTLENTVSTLNNLGRLVANTGLGLLNDLNYLVQGAERATGLQGLSEFLPLYAGELAVLRAFKAKPGKLPCPPVAAKRVNPFELAPTHPITKSRGEFAKLKADIGKNGIKEPISYVEHNGQKYILDGYHRARAAKELGLKDVPVQEVQLPFRVYNTIDDVLKGGW